ncbi:muts domain V-domain-containing protein [Emericellopsis atlantica]|uniref:MutS protein homolog 3 n=1 Tax=Emericellopsis atlantica TaxID=2614577 RepID=A0A9P7ZDR3_9HYPO|nr:muts domain V-domain-containing protein [Emericellopsis atlantica]KAG9249907.1 muts domain V-domain-containing protein [Emericellopsis atlantica]
MAPPSEKKQKSLTSFFTPKTANGLAAAFQKQSQPPIQSPATQEDASLRKRPREEPSDEPDDQRTNGAKKKKIEIERPSDIDLASSARAERFLHTESTNGSAEHNSNGDDDADVDAETRRINQELHRKFVKKLGHPDAMAGRWGGGKSEPAGDDDNVEGEDDDDEPPPPKTKKKGSKTGKLTPMEIQFLDIKRKHMDTLLIMEVGYKFRFFGEDARIAAKELSIVCIPGKMRYDEHPSEAHLDRFASASIPVHRLPVHAKRLVAAGHKVGVVRQIETAALKKVGDNRNAPFTRKLTNLYTKGTYVDEVGELDHQPDSGAPSGGYLLCLTETKAKGWGTDERVDVGIIAVQPATGDIIYDNFEDGFMRSEIETRLLHISPCEFLIVGELTKGTEKLVQHLSGTSTNVFGDRSRMERVPRSKTMAAESYSHVAQFYADKVQQASQDNKASALLDKVLKLPEPVTICLSAMINHLKEYGLEHIFDLTKYFQSFTTRSHMLLNGTTLESLEVYRNSTDHVEKGSLFWALDKTHTKFGRRLLRKWVGRPLLHVEQLQARLQAVEEMLTKQSTAPVDQLEKLLVHTRGDLERSLIRIYYGKCTRPELVSVLQTLQRIGTQYARMETAADTPFDSPLINDAICAIPRILPSVTSHLEKINYRAAQDDDRYEFFREEHQNEDIQDHQMNIAHVEYELDQHRAVAAEKIKKKKVEYVTVAGIEYLIEVPNTDIKHVPASWAKISGTKKVSRFHTPEVIRFTTERDQHRESLAAACDKSFKDLLATISSDYQPLRDAISALASLDCLLSLAKVAAQQGYSKPTFLPDDTEPTISIQNGRHPIAEHTLESGYIPFTTTLAHPAPLAHLITGPNMGGKSSFVRATALLVLLAQIGSFVPADGIQLTLCDAIHTRAGARDNLFAGESTFMVEVSETARILRSATPRSLVILDELGRGTSTHDGAAIAQAVLQHVVTEIKCLTLFITHYQNLARVAEGLDAVKNVHMRFTAEKGDDGEEEITFLYEVAEGVAHRSYGLNVARLARLPKKVLDLAAEKSSEMEHGMRTRRLGGAARILTQAVSSNGTADHLDQLIASIEQL